MKLRKPSGPIGRPRSFDLNAALNAAMRVFWHKGYEGSSLADLTKAMGINRPSLYAAFGDKETLFRKVLDRYSEGPAGRIRETLQEPTAFKVAEKLLLGTAELLTDPRHPSGCLMVQSALVCGEGANRIRRELALRRSAGESALRRRFKRAVVEGDLPPESDPEDLARFVITVSQGMAVQAAGGATRKDLEGIARAAMRAWPH